MSVEKPLVLVFEDDRSVRTLITRFLGNAGLRVEAYEDPLSFLERPDLESKLASSAGIWTDGDMLAVGGFELARNVRELRYTKPIYLVSGAVQAVLSREYEGVRARALFTAAYPKPFDFSVLQQFAEDVRFFQNEPTMKTETIKYTTH